jgi:hypothetical protein
LVERREQEQLLQHIEQRRHEVCAYLEHARPRAERLTMTSIISSALAAVLTAGPALGGAGFTSSVASGLGLAGAPAVWRPLCVLAMVVSVVAAISANLSKSRNVEARIMAAEICNTELDLLATFLELDQVPLSEAAKMYHQSSTKVPFVYRSSRERPADHSWTWS